MKDMQTLRMKISSAVNEKDPAHASPAYAFAWTASHVHLHVMVLPVHINTACGCPPYARNHPSLKSAHLFLGHASPHANPLDRSLPAKQDLSERLLCSQKKKQTNNRGVPANPYPKTARSTAAKSEPTLVMLKKAFTGIDQGPDSN